MNDSPLVSVIIPNYNYGHFIGECIESVINQTYSNWEIIVIDDNSNDDSVKIVNEYIKKYSDKKIQLFINENGPSGNSIPVNMGIEKMRGEYFAWLSSDDYFEPEKIECQIKCFENNPDCVISYTAANLVDENNKKISELIPEENEEEIIFKKLLKQNHINGSTLLIKREIIKKYPLTIGNDEIPDIWMFNDYYLILEIAADGYKFIALREKLHNIRRHSETNYFNSLRIMPDMLMRMAVDEVITKHINNIDLSEITNEIIFQNLDYKLPYYYELKKENLNKIISENIKNEARHTNLEFFKYSIEKQNFKNAEHYLNAICDNDDSINNLFTGILLYYREDIENSKILLEKSKNFNEIYLSDILNYFAEYYLLKICNNEKNDKKILNSLVISAGWIFNIYIAYRYASIFKTIGLYQGAERLFNRVLKLNTLDTESYYAGAYFHLGEISLLNSNKPEARSFFKKCLYYNKRHNKAAEYLIKLSNKK